MPCLIGLIVMNMLWVPLRTPPDKTENPWKGRLVEARARVEREATVETLAAALDAAWRADDWQAGLDLARKAQERFADEPRLTALRCRALWRAGDMLAAERLAERLDADGDDRVALSCLVTIHMARGELDQATKAARRLAELKEPTASDLSHVLTVWMATQRVEGAAAMLKRIIELTDPANGYPDTIMTEMMEGLPEFLDAVGDQPLNEIVAFGTADMPVAPVINLPSCKAMINGKGPYRLIVDTGGSIMLSLDEAVAEEVGLKKLAEGAVHGVSGRDEAWQTIADELRIGPLVCKRLMTRVFGVRKSTMYTCDGILGTGLFDDARMTLDFEHAALRIEPSGDGPAPGERVELRIIGDAKLMAPVTVHGEPGTALLDSGADVVALSPTRLERLFPDQKVMRIRVPTAGVGAEQAPKITLSRGVNLVFAGRTYENISGVGLDVLDTLLSSYLGIQSDVLIGMPTFRQMKSFTIDFPKRRMWIDWLEQE